MIDKKSYEIVIISVAMAFEVPFKALMFANGHAHRPVRAALSVAIRNVLGISYREASRLLGKDLAQIVRYNQFHQKEVVKNMIYKERYELAVRDATEKIIQKLKAK